MRESRNDNLYAGAAGPVSDRFSAKRPVTVPITRNLNDTADSVITAANNRRNGGWRGNQRDEAAMYHYYTNDLFAAKGGRTVDDNGYSRGDERKSGEAHATASPEAHLDAAASYRQAAATNPSPSARGAARKLARQHEGEAGQIKRAVDSGAVLGRRLGGSLGL